MCGSPGVDKGGASPGGIRGYRIKTGAWHQVFGLGLGFGALLFQALHFLVVIHGDEGRATGLAVVGVLGILRLFGVEDARIDRAGFVGAEVGSVGEGVR